MIRTNETLDTVNEQINLIQRSDGLRYGTDAYLLAAYVRPAASARALEWLESSRLLQGQQLAYARESLRWAARTYLVAALSAIATVLYYVSLISRRND